MGMYTEIVIKSKIKEVEDLEQSEKEVLEYLFGEREERPEILPNHPFFKLPRWDLIGNCSSFYHHPEPVNSLREGYLFSRSDLKNYSNEIALFFQWFDVVISTNDTGEFIGYHQYEENSKPSLVFKS